MHSLLAIYAGQHARVNKPGSSINNTRGCHSSCGGAAHGGTRLPTTPHPMLPYGSRAVSRYQVASRICGGIKQLPLLYPLKVPSQSGLAGATRAGNAWRRQNGRHYARAARMPWLFT